MSIQRQFKRQGENIAAAGLWGLIFYIIIKHPWKVIISIMIIIFLFGWIINDVNSPQVVYFVAKEKTNICTFPDGDIIRSIFYNDSITGINRVAGWISFKDGQDTLYINENDLLREKRFDKWEALENYDVQYDEKELLILNHPDKHLVIDDIVIKNGEELQLLFVYDDHLKARYKGSNFNIDTANVIIDWNRIVKKYPFVFK